MTKEELLKELEKLPKIETNNPISTMNVINVDDLMSAVDRLNKVPDYNGLLKENQELKKQLEEYQLQNIDLRADIMIQKMAFPNKLIKDKTFYNLYNMSTYEELLVQQKEFIKYLEDEIKTIENKVFNLPVASNERNYLVNIGNKLIEVLQKYKEIIGEKNV